MRTRPAKSETQHGKTPKSETITNLTSGVDDVAVVIHTVALYALGERILDSGKVGIDKSMVDVLHDEGGFTCGQHMSTSMMSRAV